MWGGGGRERKTVIVSCAFWHCRKWEDISGSLNSSALALRLLTWVSQPGAQWLLYCNQKKTCYLQKRCNNYIYSTSSIILCNTRLVKGKLHTCLNYWKQKIDLSYLSETLLKEREEWGVSVLVISTWLSCFPSTWHSRKQEEQWLPIFVNLCPFTDLDCRLVLLALAICLLCWVLRINKAFFLPSSTVGTLSELEERITGAGDI